ncbi:MAG TPA: DUF4019 domain-containing protein [Pyrinomonadaceae bacterium]|jgi:hypothetical protein
MFFLTLLASGLLSLTWQAAEPARVGLTVPAAPWTLTLPGDGVEVKDRRVKPDGRYGYFLLSDEKNKLMVSAFIEPAVKCKSSRECRDRVWKAGNPLWENPQNLVLSEMGGVSYFEFLIPTLQGVPVRQQHMYVQFVVEGYWVDMHISKPLYEPREHELFERLVKSVRFEPKKEGAPGVTPEAAAQKVAEAWLPLLDSGRYAESWGPLSAKIKSEFGQRQWEIGMMGLRKPLGELKSRRLGKVIYIKSLPGHPGYEGVIVRFDSVYEKRMSVIELVGLIHDDDGEWRVLIYDVPD